MHTTHHSLTALALTLILCLTPCIALADGDHGHGDLPCFWGMQSDDDEYLTPAEAATGLPDVEFATMDANGDGKLDHDEYHAWKDSVATQSE